MAILKSKDGTVAAAGLDVFPDEPGVPEALLSPLPLSRSSGSRRPERAPRDPAPEIDGAVMFATGAAAPMP